MRKLATTTLLAALVVGQAGLAHAETLPLDDEHLYLKQDSTVLSIYSWGHRHRGWGWYRPRVYEQVQHYTYITKGSIPISTDRFIRLIDASQADPAFTAHIAAERDATRTWGLAALGSLAMVGVGVGLSTGGPVNGTATSTQAIGTGLSAVGLIGTIVSGMTWMSRMDGPYFTTEEAAEAIKAYNRQLDQQLSKKDGKP
ncbi:MAG TPA: hypothetical protein V6D05_13415 [Stenomitos sp.]